MSAEKLYCDKTTVINSDFYKFSTAYYFLPQFNILNWSSSDVTRKFTLGRLKPLPLLPPLFPSHLLPSP